MEVLSEFINFRNYYLDGFIKWHLSELTNSVMYKFSENYHLDLEAAKMADLKAAEQAEKSLSQPKIQTPSKKEVKFLDQQPKILTNLEKTWQVRILSFTYQDKQLHREELDESTITPNNFGIQIFQSKTEQENFDTALDFLDTWYSSLGDTQ